MDPLQTENPDPDPHQSDKLDPDTNQSDRQNTDPHHLDADSQHDLNIYLCTVMYSKYTFAEITAYRFIFQRGQNRSMIRIRNDFPDPDQTRSGIKQFRIPPDPQHYLFSSE